MIEPKMKKVEMKEANLIQSKMKGSEIKNRPEIYEQFIKIFFRKKGD